MAISAKRISEVTRSTAVGPYGEGVPVYSLAHTPNLLSGDDVVILGYKQMDGKLGAFAHILCSGPNGVGPNGDTGEFVVQTGAKAILGRLSQVEDDGFPLLARFVSGKNGGNTWYDME